MNNILIDVLEKNSLIDYYKTLNIKTSSKEYFYVGTDLVMSRAISVERDKVTVYKKYGDYIGTYSFTIDKDETKQEIEKRVMEAIDSFEYVKERSFKFPPFNKLELENKLFEDKTEHSKKIDKIIKKYQGSINSCEIFYFDKTYNLKTANGIDMTYLGSELQMEWIVNNDGKDVEYYSDLRTTDFSLNKIEKKIKKSIEIVNKRTNAKKDYNKYKVPLMLKGKNLLEILRFFAKGVKAQNVYSKTSPFIINKSINKDYEKDSITLKMIPELNKRKFDDEGIVLKDILVIKDNVFIDVYGEKKYTDYLGLKTKGSFSSFSVEPGSMSIEEMEKQDHLEILAFSDLRVNEVTAMFGSEIRLGKYYVGNKTEYITGGSISGNIISGIKKICFSKETELIEGNIIPKAVLIYEYSI